MRPAFTDDEWTDLVNQTHDTFGEQTWEVLGSKAVRHSVDRLPSGEIDVAAVAKFLQENGRTYLDG